MTLEIKVMGWFGRQTLVVEPGGQYRGSAGGLSYAFVCTVDPRAVRAKLEALAAEVEAQRLRQLNRPAPAPPPQPYGVSHGGAESLVADWMRHLGVRDAEVTRLTGDGGIDVVSQRFIAQVKNYVGSVSVSEVRELYGVAVAEAKQALLFTSGSLTGDAAEFMVRVGIPAIRYDAVAGTVEGLNDLGAAAVEHSIPEAFAL